MKLQVRLAAALAALASLPTSSSSLLSEQQKQGRRKLREVREVSGTTLPPEATYKVLPNPPSDQEIDGLGSASADVGRASTFEAAISEQELKESERLEAAAQDRLRAAEAGHEATVDAFHA